VLANLLGRNARCTKCSEAFTLTEVAVDTKPSTPTGSNSPPPAPTTVGPYCDLELVGRGAFGVVYRARHQVLGRVVALKLLLPETLSEGDTVPRFLREAQTAAKLDHPNIVPVYDAAQDHGTYYIAAKWIEGPMLARVIPDNGFEASKAVDFTCQLLAALAHAHAQGVVHRDVKPENILLDKAQERVQLTDFGLVGILGAEASKLTRIGSVMGTPPYMAPEQALGDTRRIGPASDIYSAGVVLYKLLTNRLPFTEPYPEILSSIIAVPPPPPSRYRPDLNPRLEQLCLKALAKKPEERFASAAEFAAQLSACRIALSPPSTGGTPQPPPAASPPVSSLPMQASPNKGLSQRWLVAAGTFLVLSVGFVGLAIGAFFVFRAFNSNSNSHKTDTETPERGYYKKLDEDH